MAEAAAAMGATGVSMAGAVYEGVAIDSRRIRGGELFFALAGEQTDGHRFVTSALRSGAAAAVVHRPVDAPSDAVLIQVEDTYQALHDLTRAVRRQVPERLVAITGSAGKTSTKELLARVLAKRFRVAKSPGNLNNLYGFPLALLNIPEDSEWMVAEMGMSTPGELGQISRLGKPEVVLLTNVRPAHLEFFGTLEAIAEAKAEILEGLTRGGIVVANASDPQVRRVVRRFADSGEVPSRVVWFGSPGAPETLSAWAEDLAPLTGDRPGCRFRLRLGEREIAVELPLIGRHNVDNAVAAAACASALGVPMEEIAVALGEAEPAAGRGEVHDLPGGGRLIDDSYNSNPEAAAAALSAVAALGSGRRWAVLGEMRELGPETPRFHRETGRHAAEAGFSPVIGVGELARDLVAGAKEAGAVTHWFADAAAAASFAAAELGAGDTVLIKGSRGVALEAVVERLRLAGGEA
ncbi:MAG: UDP-N-acetylmuramoyl-tripeptide--D-alanyl-D-alanine ligase [Acidobacteriota bacterium]